MANMEKMIAETFLEMAQGLESGSYGKRPKIALTGMGSEHGEENAMEAALMAAKDGVDVYYIGSLEAEGVTTVKVADDEEGHKKMEEMLANGEVDGAVTMHFPFPIGVSTVGRVVTPAKGREMFVANTTGTSSADRIEGMIKNTIYGIIAAKTCGIANPTVGILNVDGARQTEKALKELQENGYDITFAESARADGGCVMRGNDVLQGTPDIMVTDSLTGNIMVKMLSSAATGGSFEATGYGYGPGIGEGYEQLVMIVSRASGAPVIAGAIRYAAQLVRNKVFEVAKAEFAAAKKAGLKEILDARKAAAKPAAAEEDVKEPPKEIVTAQIAGIDVEEHAKAMFRAGSDLSGKTPNEIFYMDYKKFNADTIDFGVGQITSMDQGELDDIKVSILEYMDSVKEEQGLDYVFFMLTNILEETTHLLICGPEAEGVIERGFGVTPEDKVAILPGVMSRKKQMIPNLLNAFQQ